MVNILVRTFQRLRGEILTESKYMTIGLPPPPPSPPPRPEPARFKEEGSIVVFLSFVIMRASRGIGWGRRTCIVGGKRPGVGIIGGKSPP